MNGERKVQDVSRDMGFPRTVTLVFKNTVNLQNRSSVKRQAQEHHNPESYLNSPTLQVFQAVANRFDCLKVKEKFNNQDKLRN